MFVYDAAIIKRFPGVRAGLVHASDLSNGPSSSALIEEYQSAQGVARVRLAVTAISELPSVAAWRQVFSEFGVKPTQHRNAAESLLRRLDKQGGIPTISTLVDIGNLIAIRYALPVAVLDLAGITGSTTVRFATGTERFPDLGSDEVTHPEPGEVVFVDETDVLSARRWCWRQSAQSATGANTREALFVIEAHHQDADREIEQAWNDLLTLLGTYQAQSTRISYRLFADQPAAGPDSRVG